MLKVFDVGSTQMLTFFPQFFVVTPSGNELQMKDSDFKVRVKCCCCEQGCMVTYHRYSLTNLQSQKFSAWPAEVFGFSALIPLLKAALGCVFASCAPGCGRECRGLELTLLLCCSCTDVPVQDAQPCCLLLQVPELHHGRSEGCD